MSAHFFGSSSSSSQIADTECMNSQSFGRRSNWFPNPNDPNSKGGFIKTPLQRSGSDASSSGLSKRQFINQRKRRGYRNSRSNEGQECEQSDQGFNPFRIPSDNLKSASFGYGSAASFSRNSDLEERSSQRFIFKGLNPSRLNSNEVSCSDIADAVAGMKINHGSDSLKQEIRLDDTCLGFNFGREMHNISHDIKKLDIKCSDNLQRLNKHIGKGFYKSRELHDRFKKLDLSYNPRSDSNNYGRPLFEFQKNKEFFVDDSKAGGFHKSLNVDTSEDCVIQPPEMNESKVKSHTCERENKHEFYEPALGVFNMNDGIRHKSEFHGRVASAIPNDEPESETSNDIRCSSVNGLFGPQLFHKDHEMESRTSESEETSSFVTNRHMEFSTKVSGCKDSISKHRRDLKSNRKTFSRKENKYRAEENFSNESPTPMEISPIQEMGDDNNWLNQTTTTPHECEFAHNICVDTGSQSSISEEIAADLISATQSLNIVDDIGESMIDEINKESSDRKHNEFVFEKCPPEESLSGSETESFVSANDKLEISSESSFFSTETEVSSDLKISAGDGDSRVQCSSNNDHDCVQSSPSNHSETSAFVFSANTCNKFQSASHTYHYKKKNRPRDHVLPVSNGKFLPKFPLHGTTTPSVSSHTVKKGLPYRLKENRLNSEEAFKEEVADNSDLWRMCEEWRLRGNTAYSDGNLSNAEECYTKGVNCIPPRETSGRSLKSMMLCYSNRAATRMASGRIREALEDCMLAVKIDPTFQRVQVRAANCFLALGELEQASKYFGKCLHSTSDFSLNDKITMEASDGMRKTEKVAECMNRSADLLNCKTSNDAEIALRLIIEALSVSMNSERLLEMQANALFMLQKYGDVINLCERTLDFAETNSLKVGIHEKIESANNVEHPNHSEILSSSRIWRVCISFKSYFLMGRLEEALGLAEKQGLSMNGRVIEEPLHSHGLFCENKYIETIIPLLDTVRQLLHHKNSGNEAFRSGRNMEAVEHYTTALSCSVQSGPFAAICFCNRAAACKAMGQITDAISDCNFAVALDANYLKALSRRAELFEKIRDYEQSYSDLAKILSSLSEQSDGKNSNCRTYDNHNFSAVDIKHIQLHLLEVEEYRRKEIPLDMYQILGVEQTASMADIRKAYRKAALRHHPDKAAQFFAKNESTCCENWTEIAKVVQTDADKLFKIIGEAYAILSDPNKRYEYNEEERREREKKEAELNILKKAQVNDQFAMHHQDNHNNHRRQQQWRNGLNSHWTSYSSSAATGATRWPYY